MIFFVRPIIRPPANLYKNDGGGRGGGGSKILVSRNGQKNFLGAKDPQIPQNGRSAPRVPPWIFPRGKFPAYSRLGDLHCKRVFTSFTTRVQVLAES